MKKVLNKATAMTGAAAVVTGIGALVITLISKNKKEKSIGRIINETDTSNVAEDIK